MGYFRIIKTVLPDGEKKEFVRMEDGPPETWDPEEADRLIWAEHFIYNLHNDNILPEDFNG